MLSMFYFNQPTIMFKKKSLLIVLLFLSFTLFAQKVAEKSSSFLYSGRVENLANNKIILIGSASSVSFNFKGNSCSVTLQNTDLFEHHNYVSFELDGQYIGRVKVENGEKHSYPILVSNKKAIHHLAIYKATEATCGGIVFSGTTAKLGKIKSKVKKKIEFIGNSITCGAANDYSQIPCDKGDYYDHSNGYFAYGPVLSRSLKVDYLLSSVSGIGMYRNWNDENKEEPIMPQVYEKLYLVKDISKPAYDFAFQPNIISIALGTNDFSDGDGKKERLPFNPEKFISNYVSFIKMLYRNNPNARLVLVNSPMVNGQKDIIFTDCLNKIQASFKDDKTHKAIVIFRFKPMTPHGCGGHPDIADHKVMADEYAPFLKNLLNEN